MAVSHKINKIESIAEKKIKEIEQLEYQKYNKHFTQAVKFLKKEKVLMYGGNAINDLLPKRLKFYDAQSLPDIDIFAIDAKRVASRIVKKFEEKGYGYCGFNEALHENTFKVFVEGIQILDITNITPSLYKKLGKGRVKGDHGLYIANPEFLRMTLHTLMSHPFDAYRWPKVYKRLVHFYKTFPIKKCTMFKSQVTLNAELVAMFKEWVRTNGFIYFGGPEVMAHYGGEMIDDRRDVYVDVVSVTAVAKEFLQVVPKELRIHLGLGMSEVVPDDNMFVSDNIHITSHGRKIFGIYKTDDCVSYVSISGYKIASFHTLCKTYMSLAFIDKSDRINCITHLLGAMQMELIRRPSRKKALDQFPMECYGPFESMATLRRKRIDRIIQQDKMKM